MSQIVQSIVFPGQGAQRVGMGQDFYASSPIAKQVYEQASDTLNIDMAELCFTDEARLQLTEFAQPAILTTEIAIWQVLLAESDLTQEQCVFAGHSLGEYTALVAAGALPLKNAVALVRERGRLMQQACPVGEGGMTAVIGTGLDHDAINAALAGTGVVLGNDNSANQVVLSGPPAGLQVAKTNIENLASESGSFRFVDLPVSAAFHSPAMDAIEADFKIALDTQTGDLNTEAASRVASNFSGEFHSNDLADVRNGLLRQVSGTVRWRANMATLLEAAPSVIEVGPSNPLRGFFKSVGVSSQSVTSHKSLLRWIEKTNSNTDKTGQTA